ncbi:hypothetical protein PHLGIDRAFT_44249, partial [Phlebiopsis gigantea 11061_1 CR5-6]
PPAVPTRRPETMSPPPQAGSSIPHWSSAAPMAPGAMSSLAGDFSRQSSISSQSPTSPGFDAPPQHPAHPASTRPTSPLHITRPTSALNRPPSVGTRPQSALEGYSPAPYQPSRTPPGEPHATSSYASHGAPSYRPHSPTTSFPVPGFGSAPAAPSPAP